jgi:hypothetical protein
MKLKSIVAAAALAVVSASSFASTYSFDGSSEFTFSFVVSGASSVDAAVTSSVVNGYGFDITSVLFDGTPFESAGISAGGITSDFFSYSAALITPGLHSISVYGDALGSSYHGNVVLTPVPEPETYALMLAGLGVGGFLLRRRRQD